MTVTLLNRGRDAAPAADADEEDDNGDEGDDVSDETTTFSRAAGSIERLNFFFRQQCSRQEVWIFRFGWMRLNGEGLELASRSLHE